MEIKHNFKSGFTFAETLITILIIGVVTVITIPTLVQSYKDKIISARVKKSYSLLTQTFNAAREDKGTPIRWGLQNGAADATSESNKTGNKNWYRFQFEKNIKVSKNCENKVGENCTKNTKVYALSQNVIIDKELDSAKSYYKFITDNQMSIILNSKSKNCELTAGTLEKVCGEIYVDINGPTQGSNTIGEDLFKFYLTKTGILPYNASETNKDTLIADCIATGESCSAYVLRFGNAKYLLKK